MPYNGKTLLDLAPIKDMRDTKVYADGVSYGLSEAGYDIRIKQDITFTRDSDHSRTPIVVRVDEDGEKLLHRGRFMIASAMEEFQMPDCALGIVHDKSSWARRGLSVFNTVIEPGWKGFLTLELVYHGDADLHIPAGAGIAQVIFHKVSDPAVYDGRYQNQEDKPVEAIDSGAIDSGEKIYEPAEDAD